MERLVEAVVEAILGLHGPIVYLIVGILSWAEAAFFLGLVTPGEIAMVIGGVLTSRGQVELGWMVAAAVIGTVTGNTTGYWLGRVWGDRLLAWGPFRRLERPMRVARRYFRERGEWTVVLGRFASFLRIFVPFVAGASRMPFGRFVAIDAPTGAVWAALWVLAGFVLGESWGVLRGVAGPAAILVLLLVVIALLLRWAARRVAARQEQLRAALERFRELRLVHWIRRRFGAQLRWLGRRLDPRVARGLNLTLAFGALVAAAGAVLVVLGQTRAVEGLAQIDFPVLEWMSATRTPEAVLVARTLLEAFIPPGMIALTVVLVLYAGVRIGAPAAVRTAVGMLGAGFGAIVLDRYLIEGFVPRAEFPAAAVAVAAALVVHATAVAGSRLAWRQVVATAATGVFIVVAVGLASLVAGIAAPTGIAFGAALGTLWALMVEIQARVPGLG